jgi:hypothetical protein
MATYVLFDPMVNQYIKSWVKTVPNWQDAKQYKKLGAAKSPGSGAGLMNVSRNVPPGYPGPNKYYQNIPNVEVHEYDAAGNFVRTHVAPPQYFDIVF